MRRAIASARVRCCRYKSETGVLTASMARPPQRSCLWMERPGAGFDLFGLFGPAAGQAPILEALEQRGPRDAKLLRHAFAVVVEALQRGLDDLALELLEHLLQRHSR